MCFDSFNIPMTPPDELASKKLINNSEVRTLIESYLKKFDLTAADLSKKYSASNELKKVIGKTSLSEIRAALCYYLCRNTPFSLKQIALSAGYGNDHSAVIYSREKARKMINNRDEKFLHYWNLLMECEQG